MRFGRVGLRFDRISRSAGKDIGRFFSGAGGWTKPRRHSNMTAMKCSASPPPGKTFGGMASVVVSVVIVCAIAGQRTVAAEDRELSVPYDTRLKGLWFGTLRDAVAEQSLTIALRKRPPATVRQLQKRAEDDIDGMTAVLRAGGYLDAVITPEVASNRTPARVTFRIRKGRCYTIRSFRVVYAKALDGVPPVSGQPILAPRQPASVEEVEAAEAAVLRFLREQGYPDPRNLGRVVTLSKTKKAVEVTCTVAPGARATLGAVDLRGLVRVDPDAMRRRVSWREGAPYNVAVLEQFEKSLLHTRLFASAKVSLSNTPDADGNTPVLVNLVERPRRTLQAGVSYHTDEGFGGEASWENRNLYRNAEALAFTLFASKMKYGIRSSFLRPDIVSRDVDLRLQLGAASENPDAYRSRNARLALLLEKRVGSTLTLTGGTAYELARVEQQDDTTQYGLASLPLSAGWDRRDDKLNPSRGVNMHVATTPYKDLLGDATFLKSQVEGSFYASLAGRSLLVLATRGTLGSIVGAAGEDVPADKRFYAGGGATIRGYKYQSVGELENGEPIGGMALAAVSTELRARLSPGLDGVLFMDGGTAYPGSHPDSQTPFRWGAGLGVRYRLGFVPLRLDVAFPLQRREDIDAALQIYLSLGESF